MAGSPSRRGGSCRTWACRGRPSGPARSICRCRKGPRMATNWPRGIAKSMPRRISTSWVPLWIVLHSPRISRIGVSIDIATREEIYYDMQCFDNFSLAPSAVADRVSILALRRRSKTRPREPQDAAAVRASPHADRSPARDRGLRRQPHGGLWRAARRRAIPTSCNGKLDDAGLLVPRRQRRHQRRYLDRGRSCESIRSLPNIPKS